MKIFYALVLLLCPKYIYSLDKIKLVTFDGSDGTTFSFHELNDPVMGGVSNGKWSVNKESGYGIINGTVKDVPSLQAPGFIKASAGGHFQDVSQYIGGDLILMVRSSTPEYKGFRVSFVGNTWVPFHPCGSDWEPLSGNCFKARFDVPAGDQFSEVRIPFNMFSEKWDPATGDQEVTCAEDPSVCPTAKALKYIERIEIWAEGANGDIHLEVQSISAGPSIPTQLMDEDEKYLVTFDGAADTTFKFEELTDPVMGGVSTGTWTVDSEEGFGIMNGTVADVPFLQAPGFIKAVSKGHFTDVSNFIDGDFILKVRSSTADYTGFRVTFSADGLSSDYACGSGSTLPFSGGCFKANFKVPAGNDFTEVRVPFNMFSDHWSPATGDQTKTCAQHPEVCPTAKDLRGIKRIELWAEGVKSDIHLEVKAISAGSRVSSNERATILDESDLKIVTFDGASKTTHKFHKQIDPVMGGVSTGSWSVDANGQYGILNGSVKDVPSLHAPGFVSAYAGGRYVDVSKFIDGDLVLKVRSSTPDYRGYRISFAAGTIIIPELSCASGGALPFSGGCFKADFNVPAGDEFTEVRIPFNMFSDHWNSATGNPTKTCAEDPKVCPTAHDLSHIHRIDLWAEGVKGDIHLEVQSISASHTRALAVAQVPDEFNTCQGPVMQDKLLYGMKHRTTSDYLPVPVDAEESLVEAVCCDSRTKYLAEPRYTYEAPDIRLFNRLDKDNVTTFYDPVCGLPLFKAPVGRTFEEFQEDTREHGWPSFRQGEVFEDNVVTDRSSPDSLVVSKCGTHLGTFLPDDAGERWCIDLSCISGPAPQ